MKFSNLVPAPEGTIYPPALLKKIQVNPGQQVNAPIAPSLVAMTIPHPEFAKIATMKNGNGRHSPKRKRFAITRKSFTRT